MYVCICISQALILKVLCTVHTPAHAHAHVTNHLSNEIYICLVYVDSPVTVVFLYHIYMYM